MWALETLGILALPLLVARFLIVFEADQGRVLSIQLCQDRSGRRPGFLFWAPALVLISDFPCGQF